MENFIFQILSMLHDAGCGRKNDRVATLEEYTLYIDIITSNVKDLWSAKMAVGGNTRMAGRRG